MTRVTRAAGAVRCASAVGAAGGIDAAIRRAARRLIAHAARTTLPIGSHRRSPPGTPRQGGTGAR